MAERLEDYSPQDDPRYHELTQDVFDRIREHRVPGYEERPFIHLPYGIFEATPSQDMRGTAHLNLSPAEVKALYRFTDLQLNILYKGEYPDELDGDTMFAILAHANAELLKNARRHLPVDHIIESQYKKLDEESLLRDKRGRAAIPARSSLFHGPRNKTEPFENGILAKDLKRRISLDLSVREIAVSTHTPIRFIEEWETIPDLEIGKAYRNEAAKLLHTMILQTRMSSSVEPKINKRVEQAVNKIIYTEGLLSDNPTIE